MNNNDTKINELMLKVAQKKEELGSKPKFVLNTNGLFKNPNGTSVNINTVNDESTVVYLTSILVGLEDAHKKACEILGVDVIFKHDGFTLKDWVSDFKNRIALIKWNQKKTELDNAEKKLAGLMSEDAKTSQALKELEGLI